MTSRNKSLLSNQNGSVLLALIIMMPFFMLALTSYMQLAVNNYYVARHDQYRTHAQFAADAGIDAALEKVNTIAGWTGSGSDQDVQTGGSDINSKYLTVVTTIDGSSKKINSTGKAFFKGVKQSEITIEVKLKAVGAGNFSIVTGVGGLYMSNSAKVLGGDVFVNGEINMQGSSQIGLSTNSVNLDVANQNCPLPSNPNFNAEYPRVCTSADSAPQPISISNPAWIYGNIKVNNQSNGSRMSNAGLLLPIPRQPPPDPNGVTPKPLPVHDRTAQKNAINPAYNRTGSDASCTTNNGTKTWEANTKITGDVEIDKKCTVTIKGDVWITGNFQMSHQDALLKVDDGLTTTQPKLMIDGQITSLGNGSTIKGNSSNTGVFLISYWTTASCYPECIDVTGSALYNTRNSVAITMRQSSKGPETVFYSKWGKVLIENSGDIGALVGQTIELQNSGTITFGSSVPGSETKFWLIDGYRRNI